MHSISLIPTPLPPIQAAVKFNGGQDDNQQRQQQKTPQQQQSHSRAELLNNNVFRGHDLVDLELSGHGFKRSQSSSKSTLSRLQQTTSSIYANIPAGVKSALIASATIVCTALVILMAIFLICRWRQKKRLLRRRRNSDVLSTYNNMKSKLSTATTITSTNSNSGLNGMSLGLDRVNTNCRKQSLRDLDNNEIAMVSTITTVGGGTGSNNVDDQLQHQKQLLPYQMANGNNINNSRQSSIERTLMTPLPQHQHYQQPHNYHHHQHHQHHHQQQQLNNYSRLDGKTPSSSLYRLTQNSTNLRRGSVASSGCSDLGSMATGTSLSSGGLSAAANNYQQSPTTPLTMALQSTGNKLNTMDTNSPEVHEYLFDALRKAAF